MLHPPLPGARLLAKLRRDPVLWVLLALALALFATQPGAIAKVPSLIDWQTIAALTGLLLLTKAIETSGALEYLAQRLAQAVASERQLALVLVGAAALLSMVVTNDVALFAVVPLTLSMGRSGELPTTRLVIFEALAVNAGSCLTPIGNPQNLYIWQHFQLGFGEFISLLWPVCLSGLILLVPLTWVCFGTRSVAQAQATSGPVRRPLLVSSLALYLPFLVLTQFQHSEAALAVLVLVFAVGFRGIIAALDWPLLLVFVLMFVDLRLLAGTASVHSLLTQIGLDDARHLYWSAIGLSQFTSNVPAAILLTEYSRDSAVIGAGVNVGGYGLAMGSLANLIALRMLGQTRAWLGFHVYSIPFLVANAVLVYSWLFLK